MYSFLIDPDTDLPTVWAKMEQQANLEEGKIIVGMTI